MTIRTLFLAAALLVGALPALAQEAAPVQLKPLAARSSALVVYGDDPCPKGQGDEIIVCARRPESERYRIPRRLRGTAPGVAQGSWTNRAEDLDTVSRAGLPDSCSTVGSNGQSGCFHQFLAQARAQRRADEAEAAAVP